MGNDGMLVSSVTVSQHGPGSAGRQSAEYEPAVCSGGHRRPTASWLGSETAWPADLEK